MDIDARLQLFDLKTKYSFQTTPGVDKYNMPLYDVQVEAGTPTQNINMFPVYQGFVGPAYIGGVMVPLQTQKSMFYGGYPNVPLNLGVVATGDGGSFYSFTIPYLNNSTSINPPTPINPPVSSLLRGHIDIAGIIATGNNIDPPIATSIPRVGGALVVPITSIEPAVWFTATGSDGENVVVSDSGVFLPNNRNNGLLIAQGQNIGGNWVNATAPFGYTELAGGYLQSATITGATQASPAVLTSVNSFQVGQEIKIDSVTGMTELNGNTYVVLASNGTTVTIDVDSTSFTAYIAGGTASATINCINYLTGECTVTFPVGIPDGVNISAQCNYFQSGLPRSILYYNNTLTLRSPPSQQYLVELDAYLTPAAFLNLNQALQFGYMAEYIARGAARKILSDTGDIEQFQFYEPLFKEQELLVWKRSQRQWTANRTETLYSQGYSRGNGSFGGGQI